MVDRYHVIAKYMDMWMYLRENGYSVNEFFKLRNIHKVAIYGYGILGRHLIREIEQSDSLIDVEWILDVRAETITNSKHPVYLPESAENLSKAELIVVCAINDFDEVEAFVGSRTRIPIVSFKEILEECNRRSQMEIIK